MEEKPNNVKANSEDWIEKFSIVFIIADHLSAEIWKIDNNWKQNCNLLCIRFYLVINGMKLNCLRQLKKQKKNNNILGT